MRASDGETWTANSRGGADRRGAKNATEPGSRLKGPKTPMQGWLRENRQEYVASGAWGGALDPEAPRSSCQAKHLPT
jgi:hypothetical protein